jgi:hypothetical protein
MRGVATERIKCLCGKSMAAMGISVISAEGVVQLCYVDHPALRAPLLEKRRGFY